MPYLQLRDQQFPLPPGEATIGAMDGATVRLPSGAAGVQAVVSVGPTGVIIRRGASDAIVLVNGVQLGVEPSPLLHGDRVVIGEHELRLGDDQKAGSTQFVSASDIAAMAKGVSSPRKPTGATGGRVVSLVDGREYAVTETGLTFGREVENDVVIASTEISRKHATIMPMAGGYVITDHSTNGVWVNGHRIADEQLLGRGDVVKMANEEFRFYADAAAPAAAPAASPTPPAPPVAAAAAAASVAPAATPVAAPAAAPVPARPAALATLEVLAEGPLKGMRFELHAALTNIGRGAHNDIAIKDDSVSDSHAKIQRRGDGWWIVDQDSTNGTYVGGRRVTGEQRLEGAPDLRFGGIKMAFRPGAAAADADGGTRAIAAVNAEALRRQAAAKAPPAARQAPTHHAAAQAPAAAKKGCGSVIAFFITVAGAGIGLLSFLLTTGR